MKIHIEIDMEDIIREIAYGVENYNEDIKMSIKREVIDRIQRDTIEGVYKSIIGRKMSNEDTVRRAVKDMINEAIGNHAEAILKDFQDALKKNISDEVIGLLQGYFPPVPQAEEACPTP